MTASTAPTHPTPATTVLARAAAAEWTRLWSLRSTWWCIVVATGLLLLIGAAAGAGHAGPEPAPIWQAAQVAMVPAQFAFLLVALLAATSDYTTGAVRSSLQWVPNRSILFVARLAVPVAFVTGVAVVLSSVTGFVAWTFLGSDAEVVAADIAWSLAKIGVVVAFGGALSIGLGLLLRNTAATLAAVFLLMFVLVVALGNSGVPWLVTASDHLPGRAVVSLLVVDEDELATSTIVSVMVGWSAAALTAGCWSLLRRDAT